MNCLVSARGVEGRLWNMAECQNNPNEHTIAAYVADMVRTGSQIGYGGCQKKNFHAILTALVSAYYRPYRVKLKSKVQGTTSLITYPEISYSHFHHSIKMIINILTISLF